MIQEERSHTLLAPPNSGNQPGEAQEHSPVDRGGTAARQVPHRVCISSGRLHRLPPSPGEQAMPAPQHLPCAGKHHPEGKRASQAARGRMGGGGEQHTVLRNKVPAGKRELSDLQNYSTSVLAHTWLRTPKPQCLRCLSLRSAAGQYQPVLILKC